ncbi:MAG: redoxin domain-containing protein [Planctomycetota bacterium]
MSRTYSWIPALLFLFPFSGFPSPGATFAQVAEDDSSVEESEQTETTDLDETLSEVLAGHSFHGEAFNEGPRQSAYIMGGTGNVQFDVTTEVPDVQRFINQGVGQLHGFWYLEAERTFRHAAFLDPDCAMAYWGAAVATEEDRERARGFIDEAMARIDSVTEREKMFIEAWDKFLRAPKRKDKDNEDGDDEESDEDDSEPELTTEEKEKRAADILKDLESIAIKFPEDIEARAFIAHRVWYNARQGIPVASHVATESLIKEIFEAEPLHPSHHYMIHLWDHRHPENAVASAARCGISAPAIAHMWHMPGHIYSRLKRYEDAVFQQEASARVDHAHMMRDRVMPDEIHNFAHNNEWLIRNLVFLGRAHKAEAMAINMMQLPRHPKYNTLDERGGSQSYGRRRLLQVLREFQMFEEAVRICRTTNLLPAPDHPERHVEYLRLGCVAAVMTGDKGLHDQLRSELETMLSESRERMEKAERIKAFIASARDDSGDKPPVPCPPCGYEIDLETADDDVAEADKDIREAKKLIDVCEKAIKAIDGHAHYIAGQYAEAHQLLKDATGEDVSWLGELQMLAGETEEGLKTLNQQVERRRMEVIPLARLAWWQHQQGLTVESSETFEKLRDCSSQIAIDLPMFARLSEVATACGHEARWLKPYELPGDIGFQPGLDSLGPEHWSPSPAPAWELRDSNEAPISSADFSGRPHIVIFYLGHGCLHCVEQIQAFSGVVGDFKAEGVDIVAISSDDAEGLMKSVDSFNGELPYYAFASDESLEVFKRFRAYDDFEQQPLHGTFLIDGNGQVLWQDISYEPFMDHEFLLGETKRLLFDEPAEAGPAGISRR